MNIRESSSAASETRRTTRLWALCARLRLAGLCCGAMLSAWNGAGSGMTYETSSEFFASGDFNGDGLPDALVLDKATGNARVGYQNTNGVLTWSASLFSGAEFVSGCGVGRFLQSDRDSLAVTAPDLNRIPLDDLSNSNALSNPYIIVPIGIGPHTLAGLANPINSLESLLIATADNDAPPERLEVISFNPGPILSYSSLYGESGRFERANALGFPTNALAFAAGITRGTNSDAMHLWQFTNAASVLGALTNLPPGSDYAFGNFNHESLPRFWLYAPGATNVAIYSLVTNASGLALTPGTVLAFTQAVQRVYVVGTNGDGSAMIQFDDGIQGVRLPGGVPSLAAKYSAGGGALGHVTGLAPLTDGKFVFLAAPTGSLSSVSARVMKFDGVTYTQISSNNLSTLTTRSNRANVWLFQSEPFVNATPNFLASLNAPDWSGSIGGLPGAVTVRVETDGGLSSGLGNPATNNLGAPPSGSAYGLPDQYRDDVSLFSYTGPRPPETVDATISPPPGTYDGAITVSFAKQHSFDTVLYRVDAASWQTYASPFALTHNATIRYYARSPGGSTAPRSLLHDAAYMLGTTGETPPDPVILTNSVFTNAPPDVDTNVLQIASSGTVFYSRHTPLAELSGFQGPTPYLSLADSPFNATGFGYFYLEDFEDGALNTPGAGASAGWVVANPGPNTDSVDGDDGTLNGSGAGGHSYYSGGSQTNLTITFDATALGGHLPTHAGIVWTDVGIVTSGSTGHGNVTFSARDANGNSLGTQVAINLGDGVGTSTTAEDRFFGVVNRGGISSISIAMTNSRDWEVDHLQYGYLDDAGFDDSIWAINLDGTGETFVTPGARPRVSHDGHKMAFLREGYPVISLGNLWVRDLTTGVETRVFTNLDAIAGFDWNGSQAELVFDNACGLFRLPLNGTPTPLPAALTPECYNGAPVVNPVDGRLAFQNVNPGASEGVYIAPPAWSSRTKLTEPTTLRWRRPAWSADGSRLAMADRTSSAFINTGVNLWTADSSGSNATQITALIEPDGFPNGAIWTPDAHALVGAGSIGGTNGLWLIPLATGGVPCHCPPRLLPTSPGSPIEFAGSIVLTPQPAVVVPGLFIRTTPNAYVVYWSTSYDGFVLESTTDLSANPVWTEIDGPYFLAGGYYEYHESRPSGASKKYFRLRYPGIFYVSPPQAELSVQLLFGQTLLTWPSDYVGYTLESTTNLMPPALWTSVSGAYGITNGHYEFRRNLVGAGPQEFFRLRWP